MLTSFWAMIASHALHIRAWRAVGASAAAGSQMESGEASSGRGREERARN